MAVIHLTDKNFDQEVLKSPIPVLVDFWAEWCPPCKAISPIIDEIANDLNGKLKVTKVNVDDSPELAQKFNVMSIPTLLIFKKGELANQIVGAMPKEHLLSKIKPNL